MTARYGAPLVVFNLIRTQEKYPRETTLGVEYENAIKAVNADPPGGKYIHYISWDFKQHTRAKDTDALTQI